MSREECNALSIESLKEELQARGLDNTGLKASLVDRLVQALEEEQAAAEAARQAKEAEAAAAAEAAANQPCKLFVGQVPDETTDGSLREVFNPFGTIVEVQFMKDRITGHHKGCAFVTFSTEREANAAIEALNEKVTLPHAKRTLVVNKHLSKASGAEHKLYVGMLSRSTTEEQVRKMFEVYGSLTEVFMMTDKQTGANKGQAFVKFSNQDSANRAIAALNGNVTDKDAPSPIQVRFAHTPQEKAKEMAGSAMGMGGMGGMPGMFPGMGGMGMMGMLPGMAGVPGMAGAEGFGAFGGAANPFGAMFGGLGGAGAAAGAKNTATPQQKGF
mmetsp:Transcript_1829/g.2393  ORF Transcript_1829/g.2393 Transcript_1829/m.2393 type:complete len:329 (-) Transcript_1829:7-993(-)